MIARHSAARHHPTALLALLVAACSAAPPERQLPDLGMPVPDAWQSAATDGAIIAEWWRGFGDPRLEALLTEALTANHDLRQAAARVETAEAEARIAGAVLVPTVDSTFNAQRQRQNFASLPIPGVGSGVAKTTSNAFGVALNFRWEVDLWGRLRAGAKAAAADLQSEQETFRDAALSLTAQTAKAWYGVTEAHLQVQLAERTVGSFGGTYRQARNRVAAGVQAPVDEHLAEANLASATANLQRRRETLARATRQLEVLLGRYPSGAQLGADSLPTISQSVPAGIPADVIARRPDQRAAERRLASALERVAAADGALYPRLTLTSSAGASSNIIEDLLDGDFFVWSIAGGLVQPIFQGGQLRAEVAAAEGRARGAAEAFAQQTLTAFAEVEAALAAEHLLADHEAALARAARAATRAQQVSDNRYGQGVEPLLVVLESQRRALDAESSLLAVRRARLDTRIDLHLALGGGFEVLPSPDLTARASAQGANR